MKLSFSKYRGQVKFLGKTNPYQFDIPEKFYENSSFLRDIKVKVTKWGNELTEKQIEAFKKVVKAMKENKDES